MHYRDLVPGQYFQFAFEKGNNWYYQVPISIPVHQDCDFTIPLISFNIRQHTTIPTVCMVSRHWLNTEELVSYIPQGK